MVLSKVGDKKVSRKMGKIAVARREEVVEATWRVILQNGLPQTSMRAIADELNCSTGVLTHHFRDKNAVMALAMDRVGIEVAQRMDSAAANSESDDKLSAEAFAFLPSDRGGKMLWSVWLQFLVYALSEPAAMKRHRRHYDWLRERLTRYFITLRERGVFGPSIDVNAEVDYLVALLDGLGVNTLIEPKRYSRDLLSRLVETHLDRVACASGGRRPTFDNFN